MSIESDLVTYLKTVPDITAIVGTRIYPMLVPQGDGNYPAIAYGRAGIQHVISMQGESGTARTTIALACWTRSYESVKTLADKVRLALDGYRGVWGTTDIDGVHLLEEEDTIEASAGDEAKRLYGVQFEFAVWHRESVPA